MATTVLLADDSAIVRKAITRLLSGDPDIKVLAEAVNFTQTIQLNISLRPQVVILDLHMHDDDPVSPAAVRSCLQGARVVAISLNNDAETQSIAADFGAVTLLDKMKLFDELIPAIKHFARPVAL